jgi:3-deoxy-D-manno-octulosonic-acid transferase
MSETSLPVSLRGYRMLTGLSAPLLNALLVRRAGRGKEDSARAGERRGQSTLERPDGFLIWIHAVSVGEANSVLPLINALSVRDPALSILLTTGTVTAARLMAERLPPGRSRHQFVPLDHPEWVSQFFEHWRPDLGLITESELWPNLLLNAEARGIPLVLLNARISKRTAGAWLRHPRTIGRLLRCFTLCLAQDADSAARLCALGALHVETPGNLKFAAPPLPDEPLLRQALEARFGARPRLLAASTHPGEEELIASAHEILRRQHPNFLTIIAPRHPERGPAIAEMLRARGLKVERRAAAAEGQGTPDIYVADTLGELGLFYRLCPIVFIGGSLVPVGGQNPLEPARLGCAVLHGPYTDNFADIMARFDAMGASEEVESPEALAGAVNVLVASPAARDTRARAGAALAAAQANVLNDILVRLSPFLPRTAHASA